MKVMKEISEHSQNDPTDKFNQKITDFVYPRN